MLNLNLLLLLHMLRHSLSSMRALHCALLAGAVVAATGGGTATYTEYTNSTREVQGRTQAIAEGRVQWGFIDRAASFVVLPSVLTSGEASSIMELLDGVEFDHDPDSVDGEPTHEFWYSLTYYNVVL